MIIRKKAYFLKNNIDTTTLLKYGFVTLNGGYSYTRDINILPKNSEIKLDYLICYNDSRVIKRKYFFGWDIKVEKFIKDLIDAGLVYKKNYYYCIAWDYRKWSDKKREKIERKIEKLQNEEDKRINERIGVENE